MPYIRYIPYSAESLSLSTHCPEIRRYRAIVWAVPIFSVRQAAGLVNVVQSIQENSVRNVENRHRKKSGSVQNAVQKTQENSVVSVERREDNVSNYI